ncbi:MAG: response regulator [Bacteroidetes bacterium]|nr:response regulator [Bacteroidota bacterium]MCY4234399.1 response regulator [Bacteroidota bacterium]
MKLSYDILWVDDNLDSIAEDRRTIEEFLEGFGIYANISPVTNSDDDLLNEHIHNPDLEILLVDYHMDDMDGADLINRIRQTNHVYLPVIFYSSSPLEVLLKAANEAQLDGVYIAQRDFLIQKFQDVAKSLLNKEHTIKRIRGLLMEEVSEIDEKLQEIFRMIWNGLSGNNKKELMIYLKDKIIQQRADSANKKLKNFPNTVDDFSQHMSERFLSKSYDTYTRCRIVNKMLGFKNNNLGEYKQVFKEFFNHGNEDSINRLRNNYAHTPLRTLKQAHSLENCVKIRKELHRQLKNINRIIDYLSAEP